MQPYSTQGDQKREKNPSSSLFLFESQSYKTQQITSHWPVFSIYRVWKSGKFLGGRAPAKTQASLSEKKK
jgi:hypothetical protein